MLLAVGVALIVVGTAVNIGACVHLHSLPEARAYARAGVASAELDYGSWGV
jgi:hypothetical protein